MGGAIPGWDWRHHGITSHEARARIEHVLAVVRVCALPVLLATILGDAALSAANRTLAGDVTVAYAVLCGVVLILTVVASEWVVRARGLVHSADIALASVLMYLLVPSPTPFVLAVFLLLAAAARWGPPASMVTGGVTLAAFVAAAVTDSGSAFTMSSALSYGASLLTLMLVVTALAGQAGAFLAQREVLARALASIGTASSFAEALQLCLGEPLAYLRAAGAVLAVEDLKAHKAYLWRIDGQNGARPTVEDLASSVKPHYLGGWGTDVRVWFVRRRADRAVVGHGLSTDGRPCTLSPAEGIAAESLFARHEMASFLAVEAVLGEWRARLLVLDPAEPLPSGALAFLRLFVDRAGPLVRQDYNVRLLRSRVGTTERARIAQELHDGPIQALVGFDLEIEALRRQAEQSPIHSTHLARLRHALGLCIADTRDLMLRLQPTPMTGDDVLREIAELAVRLRREGGLDVRLVSRVAQLDCSPRTCRHLTRIVQEALTNVRKHSGARTVTITVGQTDNSGQISIQDDGRGFGFAGRLTLDELNRTDLGPRLIKERVRAMHGSLTIASEPGSGARIEVGWPRYDHA